MLINFSTDVNGFSQQSVLGCHLRQLPGDREHHGYIHLCTPAAREAAGSRQVELDIETKLRVFEPCAPIEADDLERDEMGPSPQKKVVKSQSTLAGLAVNGLEHSLSKHSLQKKPTKKVMSPKARKAVL